MSKADRHACCCRNRCTTCRDVGDMGATARLPPRRKTTTRLLLVGLFLGITVVAMVRLSEVLCAMVKANAKFLAAGTKQQLDNLHSNVVFPPR